MAVRGGDEEVTREVANATELWVQQKCQEGIFAQTEGLPEKSGASGRSRPEWER